MSLTESQINMLQKKNETNLFENKMLNAFCAFWLYVFKKIIFICISFKVWAFSAILWISTWLVINDYINGSNWAAVVISLITTVLCARELAKFGYNNIAEKVANNPIVDKVSDAASVLKNKILNETEELDD